MIAVCGQSPDTSPIIDLTIATAGPKLSNELALDRVRTIQQILADPVKCDNSAVCSGSIVRFRPSVRDYSFVTTGLLIRDWDTFSRNAQTLPINAWVVGGFAINGCRKKGVDPGPRLPQGCANVGSGWFAVSSDAEPAAWGHEFGHAAGLKHRPLGSSCIEHPCNLMSCVVSEKNRGLNQNECDLLRIGTPKFEIHRGRTASDVLLINASRKESVTGRFLADHSLGNISYETEIAPFLEPNLLGNYSVIVLDTLPEAPLSENQLSTLFKYMEAGGKVAIFPPALRVILNSEGAFEKFGLQGAALHQQRGSSTRLRLLRPKPMALRGIDSENARIAEPWMSFDQYRKVDWLKEIASIDGQPVLWAGSPTIAKGKLLLVAFGGDRLENEMKKLFAGALAWLVGAVELFE